MLVIHNAKIHTLDPLHPAATALAVDHGRIIAVGENDEIFSSFSTSNRVNADGHTLIPGLTDAHIHLENYALSLQKIDCETDTQSECISRVQQRAGRTHPGDWVLGHGWNQNRWTEGYGNAHQLDEAAPRTPVYLTHKSLHCGWANTAALQLAGINRNTSDPDGGRIGRTPEGDPDGIVYETAMDLVENAIPEPSLESVVEAISSAQPRLWSMGITSVHDFDRSRCFSALQVMHQSRRLQLRVLKSIPLENLPDAIALGLRSGFGDDMLRIGSVKVFSDGALGPHTAAMLQPYEDDPGNIGILMMDAEELFEHGQLASRNGLSMAVHAIGDRANHEVLNAFAHLRSFEQAHQLPWQNHLRHRIEHVQVLHPDDTPRFSELNIIASMQPIHATSDMRMADKFWGRRSAHAYAWRDQLSHGSSLIFGSDAPVESPDPFLGIHAAVTRRRTDGSPSGSGWFPEQRLTIDEALHGFTTGPAAASLMEDRLGRITPGYLADLIILDRDPFTCPPDELYTIRPIATMLDGNWVFSELN